MKALGKGPSPAMLVAVVAMAFALVGTAVAANDGAIYPKITKSKVKKIAKKQADKELKANVSGSHVNLADQATTADEAATVGGQTPHKIFTKIPTGTGATTALEVNGLKLSVACTAVGGDLQFTATTSVDKSLFGSDVVNGATTPPTVGGNRSSDFGTGDTLDVLQISRGSGTFTYSQPNGSYVSGTFTADDSNTFGDFDGCVVVGTAFSG